MLKNKILCIYTMQVPSFRQKLNGVDIFYFSGRLILLETSYLKINVISQSLFLTLLTENVLQKYKFISL